MGYLTPLGLGGCRPVALTARIQPAGPRLWQMSGAFSHPHCRMRLGETCHGRMR